MSETIAIRGLCPQEREILPERDFVQEVFCPGILSRGDYVLDSTVPYNVTLSSDILQQ